MSGGQNGAAKKGNWRDWGAQDLFQRPRPESRACGVPDDGMTWDEVMTEVVMKVVRNSASQEDAI